MAIEFDKATPTVKWGQYLRAPDSLLQMFERAQNASKGLSSQASFKRGSKTHLNDFYHVSLETAEEYHIESEFLRPLLKSPSDTATIRIHPNDLPLRVFVCRETEVDLRQKGKTGALAYIAWGKTQRKQGIPYPEWRWIRERKPAWYALPENESPEARIFLTNALGGRHLHKYSETTVIADKRLHVVLPKKKVNWKLLIAVLNSSFVAVSAELVGRIVKGDGVLEVDYDDLRDHLRVPDVREFSDDDTEQILDAFSKLVNRPIESVEREITKPDRIALDKAVLSAIGLSPDQYLKPLYRGLLRPCW